MAVLTDNDRATIWADIQRKWSVDHTPCGIIKADLRAAVDAIDTWVDANATAFNAAIPQPARGTLTAAQKAHLLALVVTRRWEVS